MLNAIKREIKRVEEGGDPAQAQVQVRDDDFHTAMDQLAPSVPLDELKRYDEIAKQYTTAK